MESEEKRITLAVNGGIGFGAKLNNKQLVLLAKYLDDDQELELTTFQQLYIQLPESRLDEVKQEMEEAGLAWYPVGPYVKSLRTCNFCKGAEVEGMPVAIELNKRIAGKEVPFTLRPAYTGCFNGCGEPLVNDIGIMKRGKLYDLYIGGRAKGTKARTGVLYRTQLQPDELYETVEKLIEVYQLNGKKREDFSSFIDRVGQDNL